MTPRLDPRKIVRETWDIARRNWRALVLVAAVSDALVWSCNWAEAWLVRHFWNAWAPPTALLAEGCLKEWLEGLCWMATAVIVVGALHETAPHPGEAVRRALRVSGQWSLVVLILMVFGAGVALLVLGLRVGIMFAFQDRNLFLPVPWLLKSSPVGVVEEVGSRLGEAGMAYIAFAPLALALDSASAGSALAVSWRRVRGNWLRVCAGAILLWIPYGALRIAFRLIPSSPAATWTGVVLKDIAWAFLLVGAALMYVRLIQFGSGPPPASDLAEPPCFSAEPASS